MISYVISSPLMRRIMAWRSGQQRPYLPWVGLPNVLANDFVVPELLQEEASPEALADALRVYLSDETRWWRGGSPSLMASTSLLARHLMRGQRDPQGGLWPYLA